MQRFEGKRVLVTGATGGLGTAICRRLGEEGATLVATDIAGSPLDDVPGGAAARWTLDVSDEAAWESVTQRVQDNLGGLDVLVNNAGIGSLAGVGDETLERWNRVVAVDQTGTWLGMKHAGNLIEQSGGGSIVNICSILGSTGGLGNSIAYHGAKGAVRTMTKSAALQWATRGVRVNSVHPGFIGTEQLLERHGGSDRYAGMIENTPMGRLGHASEVAAAVAYLGSDDSTYTTGSELYVDGGWFAR
jgi:3alpha(or 20beta)-hydroxysteroid dehydrogenase